MAPNTQRRLSVLDEVMDISANLMRMIQQQTQQRFEASQQSCNDTTSLPWPLITEDPAGATEKLAKSIRHTVALAEQREYPPKAPPAPQPEPRTGGKEIDLSRMSDADLANQIEAFRHNEAREPRERERERERPENQSNRISKQGKQLDQVAFIPCSSHELYTRGAFALVFLHDVQSHVA